jgi:hypothetical protein
MAERGSFCSAPCTAREIGSQLPLARQVGSMPQGAPAGVPHSVRAMGPSSASTTSATEMVSALRARAYPPWRPRCEASRWARDSSLQSLETVGGGSPERVASSWAVRVRSLLARWAKSTMA